MNTGAGTLEGEVEEGEEEEEGMEGVEHLVSSCTGKEGCSSLALISSGVIVLVSLTAAAWAWPWPPMDLDCSSERKAPAWAPWLPARALAPLLATLDSMMLCNCDMLVNGGGNRGI